jgi:glycosyltransferase involved in cell wall biosynthesis
VRLLGFVQPEQLAELMHTSSCLILPSHIEWYGVVVHEAAAAGLPLICSDGVGAVPHLLQDNFNGWTVPAGDVDELAEAYRRYRATTEQPWGLDVAGGGPLAGAFEGIDGVRLLGFVQPEQLAELMHTSSCLILPSHIEWYGVVVHEAAVAGLPLICSDGVGAVPHLLQDNFNGWTVPAGNVAELAVAMGRMSAVGAKRLGEMSDGSRALGSRLSPQIWARNLHEELERQVRKRAGNRR